MTSEERIDQAKASADAVDALTYRIRTMDPDTDPAAVAAEFIAALCGQGWRATPARQAPSWKRPLDVPAEPNADWRAAREALGGAT